MLRLYNHIIVCTLLRARLYLIQAILCSIDLWRISGLLAWFSALLEKPWNMAYMDPDRPGSRSETASHLSRARRRRANRANITWHIRLSKSRALKFFRLSTHSNRNTTTSDNTNTRIRFQLVLVSEWVIPWSSKTFVRFAMQVGDNSMAQGQPRCRHRRLWLI